MGFKAVVPVSSASPGPIGATTPSTGRFTGLQAGIVSKNAAYTATSADFTILCNATTAAFSITLPTAASQPGRIYNVKKTDASANAVTIAPNAVDTIDGAANRAVGTQFLNVQFQSDGVNGWWVL
jgi:hypothetical protein